MAASLPILSHDGAIAVERMSAASWNSRASAGGARKRANLVEIEAAVCGRRAHEQGDRDHDTDRDDERAHALDDETRSH